ncbi:MAG: hypothetical protein U1E28_03340 [Beijerinckiaceae bacterium]
MRRRLTLSLAVALQVAFVSSAFAETIGYAQAYDRIASACGKDVQRLCAGVHLGNHGIRECLESKASQVSGNCKSVMASTFALLQARIDAQAAARRVCDADLREYCIGVQPHDGYQLSCLLTSVKVVSQRCKQVIIDAGWN